MRLSSYAEQGMTWTEVPGEAFYDGQPRSIDWLFGQLWHCSDIIPGDVCEYYLDIERGSTYAQAVQRLAAERRAATA